MKQWTFQDIARLNGLRHAVWTLGRDDLHEDWEAQVDRMERLGFLRHQHREASARARRRIRRTITPTTIDRSGDTVSNWDVRSRWGTSDLQGDGLLANLRRQLEELQRAADRRPEPPIAFMSPDAFRALQGRLNSDLGWEPIPAEPAPPGQPARPGPIGRIFGIPVIVSEHLQDVTDYGSIQLGDTRIDGLLGEDE